MSFQRKVVCFIGDLTYKKGATSLINYAHENPELPVEVYGISKIDGELPKNISVLGKRTNKEILEILGSAKFFFFKPIWIEPSGRIVAEALLSGCELILNENIGFLSFPFANNIDETWQKIERSPAFFWEQIDIALQERQYESDTEVWDKVLVLKSYGGLGDVFISLPAVYKINEVSKQLTYAVRYGLAPLFQQHITDFNVIDANSITSASYQEYDKIIDLANYPSFEDEKETIYNIPYPTHEKIRQHAAGHYIDAVACLHPNIDNQIDRFPFFQKLKSTDNYFTIHAGAGFLPKCWPLIYFQQLITKILDTFPSLQCKIITGDKDPDGWTFTEHLNRIYIVKQDITSVGNIISQSLFHIGNDSGISHLAGMFNIPAITIHGPSGPGTWGVLSEVKKIIWGKWNQCDIPCNFDTARKCEHRICLHSVSPNRVFDELIYLFSRLDYTNNEGNSYILNPAIKMEIDKNGAVIQRVNDEFYIEIRRKEIYKVLQEISTKKVIDFTAFRDSEQLQLLEALIENKVLSRIPFPSFR